MKVVPVTTGRQLKQFIRFPCRLYRGDACYVPEIYLAQQFLFDKRRHPFFKHSLVCFFLALEGNSVLGRIAAIKNTIHNAFYNDTTGFFGFFEVIPSPEAASALLQAAIAWLEAEGMTTVLGPVNYTTNDPCGLLVDGFDLPPAVKMPYNKSYYSDYLERSGFTGHMDLYAYVLEASFRSAKLERLAAAAEKRIRELGIIIRNIDMHRYHEEVLALRDVYNETNKHNWGFVPMTEEEFLDQAGDLKQIMPPNLMFIAEKNNKIIGFFCVIPNINEVLIRIRQGRLFPMGWLKLLLYKKRVKTGRFPILGILPEYRSSGLGLCIYSRIHKAIIEHGFRQVEASYVLENNSMVNKLLTHWQARKTKQYRLYRYDF